MFGSDNSHNHYNNFSDTHRYRPFSELNVIDNGMFMTMFSIDETKYDACNIILSEILGREFKASTVQAERVYMGLDTDLHGIRIDAYIKEDGADAAIYDLEPDKNAGESVSLPRRSRFYSGVIDAGTLPSGDDYSLLPQLVIIMILTYDPFGAGDMYYEASTGLKTHPAIGYDDGIRRIFIYADGKPNLDDAEYGNRIKDMVQYICNSDSSHVVNDATGKLAAVVNKTKQNRSANMLYLRLLEEERRARKEGYTLGYDDATEQFRQELADKDSELARLREQLLSLGVTPVTDAS